MSKIKITQQQMRKLQESLNESVIVEQTKNQVVDIQNRLNSCFSAGLDPDGIAGPLTKAAIEKFTEYRFQ